jgi:DNA-binding response OmpR family regulator
MFGKRKKILVLEDEAALSKALAIKLKNEGFDPIPVENGELALKEIEVRKFDLVILDLVTPKIDGFEVLKKLREKDKETPVFVVSNLSQQEDVDRVLNLGANKYFIKANVSLTEILEDAKSELS